MKTLKYFLLVGLCFFLVTCKKDKITDNINDNINSSLVIGSSDAIVSIVYNTILDGGYNNPSIIDIDVNGDNISDFRFLSMLIGGSPGQQLRPRVYLSCLDSNSMIYGQYKNDTTFLNRRTYTTITPDSIIELINYYNYSCKRISINDLVTGVNPGKFKLLPMLAGENLNNNDMFKSDGFTLVDESYSLSGNGETHNDTISYIYTTYDYSCDMFPQDEICYIGIKIKDGQSEKIGWIKLSINYKKVS